MANTQPELADALSTLLAAARRAPAALALLLRSVDEINIQTPPSDLLIDLTRLLATPAKRGPVIVTGINLLHLIARLAIAREGASVCDPFCGPGLLLAAAGIAAPSQAPPALLEGWERNVGPASLARALLTVLHVDARIRLANALVAPPSSDLFDAVISAPPFGAQPPPQLHLGASSRFRFGAPTRHADWLYVQHALSMLVPGGTAVLVMSRGPLFRGGAELDVRRRLIEADIVDCVIALPPGALSGTTTASCLLVVRQDRPAARSGGIHFIEIPARDPGGADIPADAVGAVTDAYEAGVDASESESVRARRVSLVEIAAAEFSLDPARHLPPRVENVEQLLEELAAELREVLARRAAASTRLGKAFQHLLRTQRDARF